MRGWLDYTSVRLLVGAAVITLGIDLLSLSTGGEVDWRKEAFKLAGMLVLGVGRILKGEKILPPAPENRDNYLQLNPDQMNRGWPVTFGRTDDIITRVQMSPPLLLSDREQRELQAILPQLKALAAAALVAATREGEPPEPEPPMP